MRGTWASRFPPPYDGLRVGTAPLFEDARIEWGIHQLGGVVGRRVLELGPLEGAHTYMLEQHGADSIVAVEANRSAYLKCLITKEVLGLQRARFLYGDFVAYLEETDETFDVCFGSGVLYHMQNPAQLVHLMAEHAKSLFLWTHYYDERHVPRRGALDRVVPAGWNVYCGFRHRLFRYRYGLSRGWAGFCGGNAPFSYWLSRDDLLSCLEYFGWRELTVAFDEPLHTNGPALALTAMRSAATGRSGPTRRRPA
jgi:Protein of unknown function (DUF1698)